MMYNAIDLYGIIAEASNICGGKNPEYTKEDFLKIYPQFAKQNEAGEDLIPDVVITAYVKLAHACISYNRYNNMWNTCMSLFIAHFLTLYLQTLSSAEDSVKKIINAGLAKGVQTSKSAGDLSVSYDFSIIANDFEGWGTYKQTAFGQQFLTLAKVVAKGGMVVW